MKASIRIALKWGAWIGLANLGWLYLAYYLGLHSSGLVIFQVFVLIWFLITVAGYILGLRAVRRVSATWNYLQGMKAALLISLVSAAFAVLMQIGYHTVVHPEWPQYMVEQTRQHFAARGLEGNDLERVVESARQNFTMTNYAIQSAITAVVTGLVVSAILMIFLRRRAAPQSEFPDRIPQGA